MCTKELRDPLPALLTAGIIYQRGLPLDNINSDLAGTLGPISMMTVPREFSWTRYYEKEMGKGLLRRFVVFEGLVSQDLLADIKHKTIEMENKWAVSGRRRINIDPGMLTAERLVLATTKNYTHRIYLGRGIFADLTLIYQRGGFKPLDWTYPDYKTQWSLDFWKEARKSYLGYLKACNSPITTVRR